MNAFWTLIDTMPQSVDNEARADALSAALDGPTVEEYSNFVNEFSSQYDKLTVNTDLANAIYLFNQGYSSGDTRHDFCYWLISLGHENLQAVLADPDKMIELANVFGGPAFEELGKAVWGRPHRENISMDSSFGKLPENWLYEDSIQQERFPRLYAYCHGS